MKMSSSFFDVLGESIFFVIVKNICNCKDMIFMHSCADDSTVFCFCMFVFLVLTISHSTEMCAC